jgi:DNA-binding MarR family transcriptional regulator
MAADPEAVARVGNAWRELKRGASMSELRPLLLGRFADTIEWGEVDTLDVLCVGGAMRMNELADALRVDASTATRAVQRLIVAGFAERSPDDRDRRAVLVRPTEAGLAAQREILANRNETLDQIVSGFSDEELQALAELMERLMRSVDDLAGLTARS